MKLKGIDISHWNNEKVITESKPDFVIMKASEGKTYKDPMLDNFYNIFHGSADGKPDIGLYGFYHYAHPENNSPMEEAAHFIDLVGHHAGHCIYALDWEGKALYEDLDWAGRWLWAVYAQTGVKPLIYCSSSTTKNPKMKKICKDDFGLWVAHYGVEKPKYYSHQQCAMWQYTSSPVDTNIFYGDRLQFKKYCASDK